MQVSEELKSKMSNLNVLLVDDDEFILLSLNRIIGKYFKNSYLANNGEEGINSFLENDIDLIISDVTMPKLDGIEMVKKIKKKNAEVKVLFITGHSEEEYKNQLSELTSYFVNKPFNKASILEKIDQLINE